MGKLSYKFLDSEGLYLGPKVYEGNLDLSRTAVASLGELREVEGVLNLSNTDRLQSIGNLKKAYSLSLEKSSLPGLGNLETISNSLLLRDSRVSSLGKLRVVGGTVNLHGNKKLVSLGNLERVGGFLSLWFSALENLEDLEEVGNLVLTMPGSWFTLETMKREIEGIHKASFSELLERLPAEKDHFLKRAILRKIKS